MKCPLCPDTFKEDPVPQLEDHLVREHYEEIVNFLVRNTKRTRRSIVRNYGGFLLSRQPDEVGCPFCSFTPDKPYDPWERTKHHIADSHWDKFLQRAKEHTVFPLEEEAVECMMSEKIDEIRADGNAGPPDPKDFLPPPPHELFRRAMDAKKKNTLPPISKTLDDSPTGRRRGLRMRLNDWLVNWDRDERNIRDTTIYIFYKDGSTKILNDYDYEGEKVRKQGIRNILSINPVEHYDYYEKWHREEMPDDYFAEQYLIQEMIEAGYDVYKEALRLGEYP